MNKATEARQQVWLGEVAGLQETLAALRAKTQHAEHLAAADINRQPRTTDLSGQTISGLARSADGPWPGTVRRPLQSVTGRDGRNRVLSATA
ncbi:hypothetical protein ACFYZJ_17895 [Streptomyces sp. NPDC001848]|uniref:hypothetical protein n=1 Tax=Streptomyces sp. NPDC001848 TaxID=3364618 RepID=UPI0036893DD9